MNQNRTEKNGREKPASDEPGRQPVQPESGAKAPEQRRRKPRPAAVDRLKR